MFEHSVLLRQFEKSVEASLLSSTARQWTIHRCIFPRTYVNKKVKTSFVIHEFCAPYPKIFA